MIQCNKGDIIFVPYQFTDLTAYKKRPVVVISPNYYNVGNDVIVGFITSNISAKVQFGDYHLQDWSDAGLPKPSMFRMKFATIDRSVIIKKLGIMSNYDLKQIELKIIDFIKS